MNIVANEYFLRNLRNLPYFNMNLGKSRKMMNQKEGGETFRKLSEFEIKYNNIYNRSLLMFGNIGKITFYEDVHTDRYKYLIFKDNDIFQIDWKPEDLEDLSNYILDVLRRADQMSEEEYDDNGEVKNKQVDTDERWVANDEKNKGKTYAVNQKLTKEQYRAELLKKFENKNK